MGQRINERMLDKTSLRSISTKKRKELAENIERWRNLQFKDGERNEKLFSDVEPYLEKYGVKCSTEEKTGAQHVAYHLRTLNEGTTLKYIRPYLDWGYKYFSTEAEIYRLSVGIAFCTPHPEAESDEIDTSTQTSHNSENSFWGLDRLQTKSIDDHACIVSVEDFRQWPQIGNAIEAYLQLFIGELTDDAGYQFYIKKARISVDLNEESDLKIEFNSIYADHPVRTKNAEAKLNGTRSKGVLEISARQGPLNDNYHLNEIYFFTLRSAAPSRESNLFSASLSIHLTDAYICKDDGTPLPSNNKQAVISSLLARKLSTFAPKQGRIVIARQTLTAEPKSNSGLFS